ncbi:hypothetical protein NC653_032552 [Populus alba x Populus x berolinensis]|uniref:Uncharacterized protein n=1 Tax=Populus alba x Populus x berolinensis TaxID=444605 RepID=A0AAD6LRK2_9ROSI|nr:hypothetical protein NC653_032552 [Populus alba x Populus x berolinensis]
MTQDAVRILFTGAGAGATSNLCFLYALQNVSKWGNHSSTQPSDANCATVTANITEKLVRELVADDHRKRQWQFLESRVCCDADQEQLEYEAKNLQSFVKEKSILNSEKGVLADSISQRLLRSSVTLTDKPKVFACFGDKRIDNEICMEFSSQDSGQKKLLRCIEVLLNKSLLRPTIIVM